MQDREIIDSLWRRPTGIRSFGTCPDPCFHTARPCRFRGNRPSKSVLVLDLSGLSDLAVSKAVVNVCGLDARTRERLARCDYRVCGVWLGAVFRVPSLSRLIHFRQNYLWLTSARRGRKALPTHRCTPAPGPQGRGGAARFRRCSTYVLPHRPGVGAVIRSLLFRDAATQRRRATPRLPAQGSFTSPVPLAGEEIRTNHKGARRLASLSLCESL